MSVGKVSGMLLRKYWQTVAYHGMISKLFLLLYMRMQQVSIYVCLAVLGAPVQFYKLYNADVNTFEGYTGRVIFQQKWKAM